LSAVISVNILELGFAALAYEEGKLRKLILTSILVSVALLGLFSTVGAHDLWLVPQINHIPTGETVKIWAHTGMKFGASLSAVKPERVDEAWVLDGSGKRGLPDAGIEGKSLVFETSFSGAGVALAAVALKPSPIELKADEFNEYLEHDGLPQILELREKNGELEKDARERYAKFAKAILRVGDGGSRELATKPAGLRIEILPLADPTRHSGELPVQVLFEDKPLPGVFVYPLAEGESKYEQGYETDGDGRTTVPMEAAGLWSLHCIYMRPHADQNEADWESFFATVTFFSED
jgi:uncharacterized GH25 family protein